MHPDFGSGLYDGQKIGIPYVVVSGSSTPKAHADVRLRRRVRPGPVPDPARTCRSRATRARGDGDRHALIVDRDTCTLYELYALHRSGSGWAAGSGAIWNLRSNKLRPAGWTSADAAGLPILPGLARYDEVAAGAIDHALRFTAARDAARLHLPGAPPGRATRPSPSLPPMGLRVRLKASFDISGFPPQARVILTALKRYGMILADNGSPWYISGAPDPRWSNDDLHSLGRLTGADFEVVDTSKLRPVGGRAGRDATRASVTTKVAPAPGLDSTVTVAAHRLGELLHDREAEAAADRPLAAVLVVEEEAVERVREVVDARARARCPRRRRRRGSERTVTVPPGGVSRSAFSTRFEATWSSRSWSPSTQASSPSADERDAELPGRRLVAGDRGAGELAELDGSRSTENSWRFIRARSSRSRTSRSSRRDSTRIVCEASSGVKAPSDSPSA